MIVGSARTTGSTAVNRTYTTKMLFADFLLAPMFDSSLVHITPIAMSIAPNFIILADKIRNLRKLCLYRMLDGRMLDCWRHMQLLLQQHSSRGSPTSATIDRTSCTVSVSCTTIPDTTKWLCASVGTNLTL
jgi:hypothetical protein